MERANKINNIAKCSVFDKVVIISLLLSPILQTYALGKYDVSFVLLSILAVIYTMKNGLKRGKLPIILFIYFIYWIIVHIISGVNFSEKLPILPIRTCLVFLMLFNVFEIHFFIKTYRFLASLIIIFFLIQEFLYYTTGTRILGVIESLPLALNVDDTSSYFNRATEMDRSSSFFSEPSHMAQYLLPLFAIELFYKHKWHFFKAGILGVILVMTQTGNALVGISVIGIVFFFYILLFNGIDKTKIIRISFLTLFLSIVAFSFINSERGQKLLARQDQLSGTDDAADGDTSGFFRIFRGYFVYSELSTTEKIVGVDSYEKLKKHISHSSYFYLFGENDTYLNCFQTFLVRTGIIGAVFFFLLIYYSCKGVDICGKTIVITFAVLSFMASIYFTMTMAMYLLISKNIQIVK